MSLRYTVQAFVSITIYVYNFAFNFRHIFSNSVQ